MVTTILFDIGNVLIGFDQELIWKRLATVSNLSADEIRQRIQASGVMDLHETGKLSSRELFQAIQDRGQLDPALSFEEFSLIWADIFWEHKPITRLVQTLQQHYAILLLSNVGEIHWNWLVKQFPIFSQVDDLILSYQVGYMKPAREIYHEAIRRSGSLPEQCVYIDDIAEYIKASRQLGLQGIHYQSPAQLKSELKMLDVDPW
jgi:HAD superfamily hydrolase (TIGR01509 family)